MTIGFRPFESGVNCVEMAERFAAKSIELSFDALDPVLENAPAVDNLMQNAG